MNSVLENALKTKQFVNSRNQTIAIHSETPREQCVFLQELIRRHHFKNSLEIGFAYGISSVAILEEISKNGGMHLVVDVFQRTHWDGLELVSISGFMPHLEFEEAYCYRVLPRLLEEGRIFDFVYIDSTKQFDWLLVNFFYIDKILSVNGIIVFDDVTFPGVRKLLRYLAQLPHYKVHSQYPCNKNQTGWRKWARALMFVPGASAIFSADVLKSDSDLGINAQAVALMKVAEDRRNWDWHTSF